VPTACGIETYQQIPCFPIEHHYMVVLVYLPFMVLKLFR